MDFLPTHNLFLYSKKSSFLCTCKFNSLVPPPAHPKVHVHDHVCTARRGKEGKEILADGLDSVEVAPVDETRAIGKAPIGR